MNLTSRSLLKVSAFVFALPLPALIASPGHAVEFVCEYGNQVPANRSMTVFAQKAADRIKEETGGRLAIRVFANNQPGGDTDMLSQLRFGALHDFSGHIVKSR